MLSFEPSASAAAAAPEGKLFFLAGLAGAAARAGAGAARAGAARAGAARARLPATSRPRPGLSFSKPARPIKISPSISSISSNSSNTSNNETNTNNTVNYN